MNNRDWEKFYGGPMDRYGSRVYVTLNHKGQIYLNRHTYHLLGSPSHVVFYFSRRLESLGLLATGNGFAEGFPVKRKQVGYVIMASTLCRHYGIQTEGTVQFVRPDIEERRMKLDLTRTVSVSTPRKRKKRPPA